MLGEHTSAILNTWYHVPIWYIYINVDINIHMIAKLVFPLRHVRSRKEWYSHYPGKSAVNLFVGNLACFNDGACFAILYCTCVMSMISMTLGFGIWGSFVVSQNNWYRWLDKYTKNPSLAHLSSTNRGLIWTICIAHTFFITYTSVGTKRFVIILFLTTDN